MNEKHIDIPTDLYDRVMRRIDAEREQRMLRWRFACAFTVSLVAAAFVAPTWRVLDSAFMRSGFVEFTSLAVSDARIVLASWQDFGLGILESFPVMPAVALLVLAFILLVSIRFAVTYGAAWRTSAMRAAS